MQKMKKIHEIPAFLEKVFNTRPFMIVFSVICAILIWFSISVTTYKTTHVTFYNIPVSTNLAGTLAEANGLSAVSCDVEKVNVEIEGNRSQIGRLTEKDLSAHLQIGNITTTGEFYVDLGIESKKDISFTATSITPSHATVKLDKIAVQSYDVNTSFPNVRVSAGHVLDEKDVVCEPSVIEITGPSEKLNKISRVEVYSSKNIEIDSLYSLYADEVKLYTEDGALMDTDGLEIPSVNFEIKIPVLTQKTLELTYDIRNAPGGFDLDWLRERLHLSEESITLASQTITTFIDRDAWSVGYVQLNDISLDFKKEFDISVDDEYINQSGFQNVSLLLDNEGLSSREVWITKDNISVINAPKDYEWEPVTRTMPVTVVGEEEELNNLSTKDIIVTVDLMNYNVQQNMTGSPDASISFYRKNTDENALVHMWAVGNYRVAMAFTAKERTQQTSSDFGVSTEE